MKIRNIFVFKSVALIGGLLMCLSAGADITNGDFEDWSTGNPTGWTTIDSGIVVNQNTSIVKTNVSSAAVTVNTGSQGSTDFRQDIAVVSGQTYDFSTWVYHTKGNLKVRLYVDGYRNYSTASLTNQWQQVAYQYTANSTGLISVGLRFYDQSGFDGSEIVYIDEYQPTSVSDGGGGDNGGGDGEITCTDIILDLLTDNYGYETSWYIKDASQTEIGSGSNLTNSTAYQETYCLADGDYEFTINDSYGDGICCVYGSGSYTITSNGETLASGGDFDSSETRSFTIATDNGGGDTGSGDYYNSISAETGFALKSALHGIINSHTSQGYGALWTFYSDHSLDTTYENDGTILDIYSENPKGSDPYNYTKVTNQCGTYNSEADCYNREHSFPRSWFGGKNEPMNSDVHHIFASDGYVNSKRSSYPYAVVGSATFTSDNNSKVGSSVTSGYSGTVFEPIDEFKGDLARAYFYMATRYENVISSWQNNSSSSDAVLNGSSNQVFETWQLNLLISWHNADPVSQYEIDRNNAAQTYQGNRNPFVDHPEWVELVWVN
ncbi:MAG: endonuclease I [Polaribacter sp.]|jgi:endonuclease I